MKHAGSKRVPWQPQSLVLTARFASLRQRLLPAEAAETAARDSRRLSRLYAGSSPFNLGIFEFHIPRSARSPRTSLFLPPSRHTQPPRTNQPAQPASRRYIMRNSYRDVAYHCSGKQRNPITGWQLNSLCRGRVLVAVDEANPCALVRATTFLASSPAFAAIVSVVALDDDWKGDVGLRPIFVRRASSRSTVVNAKYQHECWAEGYHWERKMYLYLLRTGTLAKTSRAITRYFIKTLQNKVYFNK